MKISKFNVKLILINITVLVIISSVFFLKYTANQESVPVITSDVIKESLMSISELSTIEYHYTNVGKFEEIKDFYGWEIPFTEKMFIVAYDGLIKAGLDLQSLKIQVKEKMINVTMPNAKIISHEMFEESIEVFDESSSVFNQIEITDFISFTKDNKQNAEREALSKGILENAQKRSESIIETYIKSIVPEEYKIVISKE